MSRTDFAPDIDFFPRFPCLAGKRGESTGNPFRLGSDVEVIVSRRSRSDWRCVNTVASGAEKVGVRWGSPSSGLRPSPTSPSPPLCVGSPLSPQKGGEGVLNGCALKCPSSTL